jgi:hypothetical protein
MPTSILKNGKHPSLNLFCFLLLICFIRELKSNGEDYTQSQFEADQLMDDDILSLMEKGMSMGVQDLRLAQSHDLQNELILQE